MPEDVALQIAVPGNAGSWYVNDLRRAATARQHSLLRLDFRRLCGMAGGAVSGVHASVPADEVPPNGDAPLMLELSQLDAVIVRAMPPGSLEQVVFRMDALHMLADQGVCFLNSPRSLECAIDKYLTTARLERAGLPVPPTVACETADDALLAFERFGGDVVVKPVFGSEGRGIVRVSDYELAFRTFRTLERTQSLLYVQQFVPHRGCDVRILILDGCPLGAITRTSELDFRTNVSCRGVAAPHAATGAENDLAVAAAAAVGVRFAGVDLLYDGDDRCHVLEVNAVPGWRAFAGATGIDVADAVISYLEQHTAATRSGRRVSSTSRED